MRALPVNDLTVKDASLRPDGQVARDTYLLEVKAPGESRGAWDYEKRIDTIPPARAYHPIALSECPLAHAT